MNAAPRDERWLDYADVIERRLTLGPDEAHVWSASLAQPTAVIADLRSLLDDDERRRADRYTFEKGRTQATVARGLLRRILGYYLATDPLRIRFRYNSHGKPELDHGPGEDSLKFNLSHSGTVVLFAVTQDREVGVDVESIRPDFASDDVAERFFALGERSALRALPSEARVHAFFTCWTRKEAFIKAKGKGLAIPLEKFEVSLTPGALPAIIATHDDPAEAGRWSLHELDPGTGYVGALAVAGSGCRVRFGTWPVA